MNIENMTPPEKADVFTPVESPRYVIRVTRVAMMPDTKHVRLQRVDHGNVDADVSKGGVVTVG